MCEFLCMHQRIENLGKNDNIKKRQHCKADAMAHSDAKAQTHSRIFMQRTTFADFQ